jgi:hypothetical protein
MARLYCQVTGILLLLVGILGVVRFGIPGFLSINEPAEIVVHFVTGALATYAGFSGGYGRAAVLYARVFGVVYLILCIGLFVPDLLPGLIHFDLGCKLVHLVLGLWASMPATSRGRPLRLPPPRGALQGDGTDKVSSPFLFPPLRTRWSSNSTPPG